MANARFIVACGGACVLIAFVITRIAVDAVDVDAKFYGLGATGVHARPSRGDVRARLHALVVGLVIVELLTDRPISVFSGLRVGNFMAILRRRLFIMKCPMIRSARGLPAELS